MTYKKEIEELRRTIDRLNEELIGKISERVEVAAKIGTVKKRHRQPVIDKKREEEVYDQVRKLAMVRNLDPEGMERVFREIIRLCTDVEMEADP